jgi:hypothetical protein
MRHWEIRCDTVRLATCWQRDSCRGGHARGVTYLACRRLVTSNTSQRAAHYDRSLAGSRNASCTA